MGIEANREFYSEEYFLSGSGGASLYRQHAGAVLDAYKTRVFELTAPRAGERILDLGCGRGELTFACLKAGAEVWALDFSPDALRLTEACVRASGVHLLERLHLVECDATEMAFPDGFFDAVLTSDFVEHILPERLDLVVSRVHSALRETGRFVVHTSPTTRYLYFGQYVARLLELLQGKPPLGLISFRQQLEVGGHCNIQSRTSLDRHLRPFPRRRVWAEFSRRGGATKRLLDATGATGLLAHHLYAVARF